MKSLIMLLVAFYSINLFAAGPVVELKAQSPMRITNVSEGDYKLPEYAMSSWYLYLPVPLLKSKIISTSSRSHFSKREDAF